MSNGIKHREHFTELLAQLASSVAALPLCPGNCSTAGKWRLPSPTSFPWRDGETEDITSELVLKQGVLTLDHKDITISHIMEMCAVTIRNS